MEVHIRYKRKDKAESDELPGQPVPKEVDEAREKDRIWIRQFNFTEDQLDELKECFALFDRQGINLIAAGDLGNALRAMGQTPTEAELQEMLQESNLDDNGNLNLDEYVRLVGSRGIKREQEMEEELEEALRVFDREGLGKIDAEDLKMALRTYGEVLEDDDVNEMMKVAEITADGKIDYQDFIRKVTTKL